MSTFDDLLKEIPKLSSYTNEIYRIVETQEDAATRRLVDSLEEQELLEQLLDGTKPDYREGSTGRHYLITTPFRYPPLEYGSRFGHYEMPSFFYGSEKIITSLTECAFYRFVFFDDMEIAYDKIVISEHMSFTVNIQSNTACDLTTIVDMQIQMMLQDQINYIPCQRLGEYLTEELKVTVLRYYSARAKGEVNLAISDISAITSDSPANQVKWTFETGEQHISMRSHDSGVLTFLKADFLIENQLPKPA